MAEWYPLAAPKWHPSPPPLTLTDPERVTLAEIGKRVGRKALREIVCVAKPDTILAWYRKLIAQKFDGSGHRQYPGRPRLDEKLVACRSVTFTTGVTSL